MLTFYTQDCLKVIDNKRQQYYDSSKKVDKPLNFMMNANGLCGTMTGFVNRFICPLSFQMDSYSL
jgi:hypothetical protein